MVVTGIGSSRVDSSGSQRVIEIAKIMDSLGFVLRSGGSKGCDWLFEKNMSRSEIFLPWKNFNSNQSTRYLITPQAYSLASRIHPYYENLSQTSKQFHARNCYQILGENLDDPSDILVCWTMDGATSLESCSKYTGGSRTAIALADKFRVPIYNLKVNLSYEQLQSWLTENKNDIQRIKSAKQTSLEF